MKLKLLALATLSIVSVQAMAWEGQGFRVINEQNSSSAGVDGSFKRMAPSGNIAQTTATTFNVRGQVRQNLRIDGQHTIYIQNYTQNKQKYNIAYKVEADGQNFMHTAVVEVDKGGYARDFAGTTFVTNKNNPGTWAIKATTSVSGESSDSKTASATLVVTK